MADNNQGAKTITLSKKWASLVFSKPETGMGYHVVTVILKDGSSYKQTIIIAGEITEIKDLDHIPFSEDQIQDIIVTHEKWNFNEKKTIYPNENSLRQVEEVKDTGAKPECNRLTGIRKLMPAGAPAVRNAYSHGIVIPLPGAELLFTTGQIASDAENNLVGGDDAGKQTEAVFENLKKILAEAGMGLENVVKAQIFLTHEEDLPVVKEVRNKYFAEIKPVSTMLVVSKLARAECRVEIEVTAIRQNNISMTDTNNSPTTNAKPKLACAVKKFFMKLFGCNPDKSGQGKESCCKTEDKAEGKSCGCGHKHDEKK